MRNFLALILIAAAGYFLYTHQDLWRKSALDASQEPYAVKILSRNANTGPMDAQVAVVNGNQWRLEFETPRLHKLIVVLSDGTQVLSNMPPGFPVATLDPRPAMNWVLTSAAKFKAMSSMSPNVTEQRDGYTCWKTSTSFQGTSAQLWINTTTGFPVCVIGTANGHYVEDHYTQIPINFKDPGTSEFFDPAHLEPIFTRYLTP
jgi:hypothetical protein